MKRYLAIILSFITVTSSFVSCSNKSNTDNKTADTVTHPIKTTTIDINEITTVTTSMPITQTTVTVKQTTTATKTTTAHSTSNIVTTTTTPEKLTTVQENSIAWLNYLAMLTVRMIFPT